ncbi:MAG TPA: cyclic nucleotide-binding domain-containing protein [Kofleriaceae bacterium]|nr:cyclic nucleotide-binding domain-containing protein [Kofleriaceae bacterium]
MLDEPGGETLRGRLLLLRALDSMRAVGDDSLSLLAEHARVRRFRRGDFLLDEGGPVDTVYIVVAGQVTVTRRGEPVAVVKRGYGAGFAPLIARDPNGVRAVADVDTTTLEIPADALLDTYERDFAFVRNVLRLQAVQIASARGGLPVDPDRPPPVDLGTWRERQVTLVERLLATRKVPLFATANLDAVVELLRSQVEVRYPAGEVLWRIGEPATYSLRIDCGRVRCTAGDGRAVDVGAQQWIGAMDCFAELPRRFEARTETPVIAYRGDIETLLAVLEAHFDMAMDFVGNLARQSLGS